MNRKEYSRAYNETKRDIKDAIKRFAEQNPERFAELQAQAQREYNLPRKRRALHEVSRETANLTVEQKRAKIDETDALVIQWRGNRKDFHISTIDCWGDTHLYFETVPPPFTEKEAEKVLRRHRRFVERSEEITEMEPCTCSLCRA